MGLDCIEDRPLVMESVRNLSGALTAIHSAEESGKTIRTSWSILRCFLFFDVCYLMSSVTLIVVTLTSDEENSEMILCGGAFGIFATISAMCNRSVTVVVVVVVVVIVGCKMLLVSLACHGLRCWKRAFLIPWLSFYLMVLGIVTTCSIQALYSHNFLLEWRHIFLFFAIFTIFYCWSHMKKQFLVMAFPRPDQVPIRHIITSLLGCTKTFARLLSISRLLCEISCGRLGTEQEIETLMLSLNLLPGTCHPNMKT